MIDNFLKFWHREKLAFWASNNNIAQKIFALKSYQIFKNLFRWRFEASSKSVKNESKNFKEFTIYHR
ncbi:unnamed protein product [Blepharisma stoltei]|uniref:Ribosomal protein L32 n=1 Tax=Blepharisma stoltei TaxID=1481888 RepID=A0AAU9JRU2_9CILI|nr:unnamed protein product [Blepharisma stoltei]